MEKHITIGELAKLFQVSTHQLRYFEEKQVLLPDDVDDNGYRMYAVSQIYQLAYILLLRRLDIGVPDIKKALDTYTPADYSKLLKGSVQRIDEEIERLQTLRSFTQGIIEQTDTHLERINRFTIKSMDKRYLSHLVAMKHNEEISARQLYGKLNHVAKLYEIDLIHLYDQDTVIIGTAVMERERSDTVLESGRYLCYECCAATDAEFEQHIQSFLGYAAANNLGIQDKLIAVESSTLSILYNEGLYFELQARTVHTEPIE